MGSKPTIEYSLLLLVAHNWWPLTRFSRRAEKKHDGTDRWSVFVGTCGSSCRALNMWHRLAALWDLPCTLHERACVLEEGLVQGDYCLLLREGYGRFPWPNIVVTGFIVGYQGLWGFSVWLIIYCSPLAKMIRSMIAQMKVELGPMEQVDMYARSLQSSVDAFWSNSVWS